MNEVQQWEEMPTNKRIISGQIALFLSEPACPKMAPLANTISAVTDDWKPYQKEAHIADKLRHTHAHTHTALLRGRCAMLIHHTHEDIQTHTLSLTHSGRQQYCFPLKQLDPVPDLKSSLLNTRKKG